MSQLNSSTSNSDLAPEAMAERAAHEGIPAETAPAGLRRHLLGEHLLLAGSMIAWLIILDLAVGIGLGWSGVPPRVRSFFIYGQSIRWKMQALLGGDEEVIAPLLKAGWLAPPTDREPLRKPASDRDPVVTFYGSSFAKHSAEAMVRIEPRITVRSAATINSSPNHSYASFQRDPGRARSDAAVLVVLSRNVTGVLSRGFTWAFDSPPPFTQPLMRIRDGRLVEEWPTVQSLHEFRSCLADDEKWRKFSDEMGPSDPFYDRFIFDGGIADRSVICGLIRKAWGEFRRQQVLKRTVGREGFIRDSETMRVLARILIEFAESARAEGVQPIVVLAELAGKDHHLKDALGDTLRAEQIAFISTSDIFSANDRRNYLPDGHYTPEKDDAIARSILELMRRDPGPRPGRPRGTGAIRGLDPDKGRGNGKVPAGKAGKS